jgi:hypothetical protein
MAQIEHAEQHDGLERVRALESARKGRAAPVDVRRWTAAEVEVRTCFHCKVTYVNAGYAYRCEHWHEGL